MIQSMMAEMICDTFIDKAGRFQDLRHQNGEGKALQTKMRLTYGTTTTSIDLIIFANENYVGVYVRNIASEVIDIMSDNNPWYCMAYHDSCWRYDGVNNLINHIHKDLITFGLSRGSAWYEIIELNSDEIKMLKETRDRRYELEEEAPKWLRNDFTLI